MKNSVSMPDVAYRKQQKDVATSIAVFYGSLAFGVLIIFTVFSIVLGDFLEVVAMLIVPILVAFALAFTIENRFYYATKSRYFRSTALRYLGWPFLAVMCGVLLTLPLSVLVTPQSPDFLLELWFGWQTTPLAILIFGTGVVDMLATWYRGKSSEPYCRLRLRGWVGIIVVQQMALTFLEIVREFAEEFPPWLLWGYISGVVLLTTLVLVPRLIILFWPMRHEQPA